MFPVDRRVALVRQTAQDLSRLHGKDANVFFRTTARALYGELVAQGHGDLVARAEVARFSDSVQKELRRAPRPERSLITA